jgi:hypothetical protein
MRISSSQFDIVVCTPLRLYIYSCLATVGHQRLNGIEEKGDQPTVKQPELYVYRSFVVGNTWDVWAQTVAVQHRTYEYDDVISMTFFNVLYCCAIFYTFPFKHLDNSTTRY